LVCPSLLLDYVTTGNRSFVGHSGRPARREKIKSGQLAQTVIAWAGTMPQADLVP
jgi:hypothetical protein